ncbi:MAG: acyltransferase family protein [Ilumatobacteraceae bacterium]
MPARETQRLRQAWIDNLRVAVIVGVIGVHVALIYALDVGWYYQERTASTAAKVILAAVFAPGLLFGMGLLFFVAGMCTPRALAAKGPRRFVVDRLWRLGLPIVAYVFVLNPAMNFVGDRVIGTTESVSEYFRLSFWSDVEFGVAWFITALLLFSVGFAAWRSRHPAAVQDAVPLRRQDLVWAMVFVAVASFAVRLVWPFLGTDALAGFNLWEYPQMVALFTLGVLAAERSWLAEGLPAELRRFCGRAAAFSLVAAMIVAVGITLTEEPDQFLGGLHLQATIIPVIEAVLAVSMTLWITDWFRRRWDRASELTRAAASASFAAYLLHAPITIMLAAGLSDVGVPAELKFLAVFAATVLASFGLGWLLTRSHVGGRIL